MALTTALGGLIGGLGGSKDARTSTSASNSTSTPGYTPDQTAAQGSVWSTLKDLMSGGASPQIQAMKTASADQINQNYSGLGDRMNRFLAARGFGKSGQVGQAALKTEIGRQGALAGNEANYAKIGLDTQSTALSDALNFAFRSPTTSTSTASSAIGPGSSLADALAGAFAGFNSGMNQLALNGGLG